MRSKNISKSQIIQAAARVIDSEGLENISVDDIAKEAGVAKGSIYVYFKSKDELFEEGVRYYADQRIGVLKNLLDSYPDPLKKLEVLLDANQNMAERSPEMFLMNYSSLVSTHKNLRRVGTREFFSKYLDLVEGIVKLGIKGGAFRKGNSRLMALSLVVTQDFANILRHVDSGVVNSKNISKDLIDSISS